MVHLRTCSYLVLFWCLIDLISFCDLVELGGHSPENPIARSPGVPPEAHSRLEVDDVEAPVVKEEPRYCVLIILI